MSDANLDRKTLTNIAAMVRPALATANYIDSLTHVLFDGEQAMAYNDVAAIIVKADFGFEGCLPGELLIKALASFSSEKVVFESMDDGSTMVRSGRSKLKLPTLPVSNFPKPKFSANKATPIELDASIVKGIQMCLMNVGNDPTHPSQMGVTLDVDDKGRAVLFSTDNTTISRYQTKVDITLPGDTPVILPTFFCQQLVGLWSTFREEGSMLLLGTDFVAVEFGKKKAIVFSKVMPELEALDFAKQIDRAVSLPSVAKTVVPIPNSWEACWQRAMLVLDGEPDKTTEVKANGDQVKLYSTSPRGEADDQFGAEGMADMLDGTVLVDPSLVLRASKYVGKAAFTKKVTLLTDEDSTFIHMIAHCTK